MRVDLDAIPRREPGMEPFEVMISESQERMLAVVRPERYADVAAVCARWGLPCAVIGRVTDDGDIAIVAGEPATRSSPAIPAAALTSRRDRPRAARRAAGAPARCSRARRARRGRATSCPSGGWTPAPCCWPCSDRRISPPAGRSSSSTTRPSRPTRSPVPAAARPCCAWRAREGPRRRDRRATRPSERCDPWLGAAMSVAEATRNVAITGARPLGVTNCLNFGDPTRPDAFWQLSEAVRGLGDACRALGLPVTGGNVSLYNESARGPDRADAADRGRRAARGRRRRRVGPAFARGRRRGAARRRGRRRAWRAASTRGSPASRPRTARRRSTSSCERRLQAFVREAAARGPARLGAGRLRRRVRGRARRRRDVGRRDVGLGASVRLPVASSPAVDLFGESPSRLVVSCRPRHAPARGAARAPARPAGRGDRDGRRRPARSSSSPAPARPAPPRSAAPASPTRSTSRSTDLRARVGAGRPGEPGRSAGRSALRCAACSGSSLPPGCGTEAAAVASHGPVRAPAPRPGVGRRRGQRRRAADALQGPRDDRPGPRRAAAPALPRRPRDRPLPLLDDRLDGLGERPADVPARAAPGGRDRPQRQPRQHPRAARPARGRPGPARRDHRHGAPDDAPRRRAGRGHGRGAAPAPAARPRRVLAARPRRAPGHRHPRPARLPAARPRPHPVPVATRAGDAAACGPTTQDDGWGLSSETTGLDIVGAEFVRDVEPGEMVVLEAGPEPRSVRFAAREPRPCACSS